VQILGVNETGHASGNASITNGRDLPWLQDEEEVDLWTSWGITYRDVVVLDAEGKVDGVMNLTDNDLSDPDTYEAMRELLRGD